MGICCNQENIKSAIDRNENNFLDLYKQDDLAIENAAESQDDNDDNIDGNSPETEDEEKIFNAQLPRLLSTKQSINVGFIYNLGNISKAQAIRLFRNCRFFVKAQVITK